MDWLGHFTLGDAAVFLGGLALLGAGARKAWPRLRDFVLFVGDLVGTPERNGRPAKPGLMSIVSQLVDRQDSVEQALGVLDERMTGVEGQAASAASAAVAADEKAERAVHQLEEVDRKVDELAVEQAQIRAAIEGGHHGTDATTTTEGDPS